MAQDKTKLSFNAISGTFDLVQDVSGLLPKDGTEPMTGTLDLGTHRIVGVVDPLNLQDAATMNYVDNAIAALPDPITYKGTWSAATNTPTLNNADTGVAGFLYQVNAAGSVNFGAGVISFDIGDKIVNDGAIWDKWDMTDAVSSVNGQVGNVVITTTDIAEGTNLYYTNARFNTQLATKTTDNLTEGVTNLYYTNARAKAASVSDTIVDGVVDVAPSQNAVFDALALKAPLASPALTGVPTAPTAAAATNTTQIATTAFVLANSFNNPMTTGGDMIYATTSGGGAPSRLASGGVGDILQANGTNNPPTWVTPSSVATVNTIVSRNGTAGIVARYYATSINTIATNGGTTVLSNVSFGTQVLTGTNTHTITLPVNNTLTANGSQYWIKNRSTGIVTVNSSGGNLVQTMAPNSSLMLIIKTTGSLDTTATPWDVTYNADNILASAVTPTVQKFTSGSGTYTTPANVKYIQVRMVGGGAGSGGSGTGTTGGNGTGGGNTTFGTTLLVANGGGVNSGAGYLAGTGGTASLGSGPIGIAINGSNGTNGGAGAAVFGPQGAPTPLGGGGPGGLAGITAGSAATGFGASGGAGGGGNAGVNPGGTGGAGGYVDAIISVPLATYPYAVGAAGTGGTAGTSGVVGGGGAPGIIIITEFYN